MKKNIAQLLLDIAEREQPLLELCSQTFMLIKESAAQVSYALSPYGMTCNVDGTSHLFRVSLEGHEFAFVRHDNIAFRSSHSTTPAARISVYWKTTTQEWLCISSLFIYAKNKMFADGLLAGSYALKAQKNFKNVDLFFSDIIGDWLQKILNQKTYWDDTVLAVLNDEVLEVWQDTQRGPLGFAAWQPPQNEPMVSDEADSQTPRKKAPKTKAQVKGKRK